VFVLFTEWQSGHVRLIWPPEDAISNDGLSVIINCTIEQMNHRDSIAWWHYDRQLGYVRLFESHPAISKRPPVYLNMDKYMIVGHYNLIVKNVSLADGGEYMCELIGRGNHSAYITVVGKFVQVEKCVFRLLSDSVILLAICFLSDTSLEQHLL